MKSNREFSNFSGFNFKKNTSRCDLVIDFVKQAIIREMGDLQRGNGVFSLINFMRQKWGFGMILEKKHILFFLVLHEIHDSCRFLITSAQQVERKRNKC